jgi:hypothetical protein
MDGPTFDIFKGATEKDAVWIEAVEGFSNARQRMEEIAAVAPGQYFVFGPFTNCIFARTDTRNSGPSSGQYAKSA